MILVPTPLHHHLHGEKGTLDDTNPLVVYVAAPLSAGNRVCREDKALVQLMPVHSASIVHLRIWEQKQGVFPCHPKPLPVTG